MIARLETLILLAFGALFFAAAAFFLWAGLILIKSAPVLVAAPLAPVCFAAVLVNVTLSTMMLAQWRTE
jgi:divalent metal cation (Fe/Co/Zn/Cd) transporter